MHIHCPVCSTSIEVTEAHLGQKGRCMSCQTKFIIPVTPGGEFEILEQGQAPAAAPPAAAQAPADPAAGYRAKPALNTPPPARRSAATRVPLRSSRKSGAGGFIVAMLVIGAAVALGFMYLGGDKKPEVADNDQNPAAGQPKTGTYSEVNRPGQPTPPPQPPVGDTDPPDPDPPIGEDPDEPEIASGEADPFAGEDPGQPAETEAGGLSEEKKARALAFLISSEDRKRKGAFTACRKLGPEQKTAYAELLAVARTHHLKALGEKASAFSNSANSLTEFNEAYAGWKAAAGTALVMVQTNWKTKDSANYKTKWKEMDTAFEAAEREYGLVVRALEKAGGQQIGGLQELTDVLGEFQVEIDWCAGKEDAPQAPDLAALLAEAGGADDAVALLSGLSAARNSSKALDAAEQHNDRANWAGKTYTKFATLLNQRRVSLGLVPLRLDAKLSEACESHSGDMHFQNYFSHTGQDGSKFGQRAKAAGFDGRPTGECIYKGSQAADDAHKAWWYSDGHRVIMYASAPNTLGLGTANKYWTLNTGKKAW